MRTLMTRYGVNLHADGGARRAATRRARWRAVRLGVIAGLGLFLIGIQILSGIQVEEQSRRLERSLTALESALVGPSAGVSPSSPPGLDRVIWFPKILAVAESIPDDMFVTEIRGVSKEAGLARRSLEFTGHVQGEHPELGPALEMVEALKRNPAITDDLPVIDVSTARGSLLLTVEISCTDSPPEPGR